MIEESSMKTYIHLRYPDKRSMLTAVVLLDTLEPLEKQIFMKVPGLFLSWFWLEVRIQKTNESVHIRWKESQKVPIWPQWHKVNIHHQNRSFALFLNQFQFLSEFNYEIKRLTFLLRHVNHQPPQKYPAHLHSKIDWMTHNRVFVFVSLARMICIRRKNVHL